ncbi:hypothetical protein NDU88_000878 [Pleurodeles waltl]|uniref:Uncharacterized protein n=1 Tax=Pleurodeles waltl TaxID=8319 RepID=A0AAV7U587_PLEWA|nr:hypothetical protein NDU88_000878 [Pleurodeles waltl]
MMSNLRNYRSVVWCLGPLDPPRQETAPGRSEQTATGNGLLTSYFAGGEALLKRSCAPNHKIGIMGKRAGYSAGAQEQRGTAPPSLPETRSVEVDLAPTLHDDKLDKILEAIATAGHDLRNRVDAVAVEVGLLREDQRKLSARVVNKESKLKEVRPSLTELEEKVSSLTASSLWNWVEQRRYEFSKSSSPNDPQDRLQRGKCNTKFPQEPGMDRVKGVPTPA